MILKSRVISYPASVAKTSRQTTHRASPSSQPPPNGSHHRFRQLLPPSPRPRPQYSTRLQLSRCDASTASSPPVSSASATPVRRHKLLFHSPETSHPLLFPTNYLLLRGSSILYATLSLSLTVLAHHRSSNQPTAMGPLSYQILELSRLPSSQICPPFDFPTHTQ